MLPLTLKFWTLTKQHWRLVVCVAIIVVTVIVLHRHAVSIASTDIQKIQDAHALEIKQINDARAVEEKQHELNVENLKTSLDQVQKQYDDQIKALDVKKQRQVDDIVRDFKDDPMALAQELVKAVPELQIVER